MSRLCDMASGETRNGSSAQVRAGLAARMQLLHAEDRQKSHRVRGEYVRLVRVLGRLDRHGRAANRASAIRPYSVAGARTPRALDRSMAVDGRLIPRHCCGGQGGGRGARRLGESRAACAGGPRTAASSRRDNSCRCAHGRSGKERAGGRAAGGAISYSGAMAGGRRRSRREGRARRGMAVMHGGGRGGRDGIVSNSQPGSTPRWAADAHPSSRADMRHLHSGVLNTDHPHPLNARSLEQHNQKHAHMHVTAPSPPPEAALLSQSTHIRTRSSSSSCLSRCLRLPRSKPQCRGCSSMRKGPFTHLALRQMTTTSCLHAPAWLVALNCCPDVLPVRRRLATRGCVLLCIFPGVLGEHRFPRIHAVPTALHLRRLTSFLQLRPVQTQSLLRDHVGVHIS